MEKVIFIVCILVAWLGISVFIQAQKKPGFNENNISGELSQGFRILKIDKTAGEIDLNVYRGDYIKFDFNPSMDDPVLSIPSLEINQKLTRELSIAPYFKMKQIGEFAFSLDDVSGNITVLAYTTSNYKEVTPQEADRLIKEKQPLILDVRTAGEYKKGHLKDAVLIPVRQVKKRMKELLQYQDKDILIYCATGNRSTVASKILNDAGFTHIYNLRHGIYGWKKAKFKTF